MYMYIYIHIITTDAQNCANVVPKHSNHFVAICAFVLTHGGASRGGGVSFGQPGQARLQQSQGPISGESGAQEWSLKCWDVGFSGEINHEIL